MPSCEFPARRITASLMFSGRRSARPEAGLAFGAPVGASDSGTTGVSFTRIEQYQNRGLNPPAIFPFWGRAAGAAPFLYALTDLECSYRKTSSNGFSKIAAILNASSNEGEYFSPSIATMVCRVTPTCSASCCCVISSDSKRNRLRLLLTLAFLMISFHDGNRPPG